MKPLFIRLVFFLNFSFLLFNSSHAQFAFIPDTNFRNFLMSNGFAGCMQGDSLDTTCTAVVNATKIDCGFMGIQDLTGIQYFDNVDTLMCLYNDLSVLPTLPSLVYLDCRYNSITSLGTLPVSLLLLDCSVNNISSLPALPASLDVLTCDYNQLTSLPSLPAIMWVLSCEFNSLTSLPPLPGSLLNLRCGGNSLSSLPNLPSDLERLTMSNNSFTSLPVLPASLEFLNCSNNQLNSISGLPTGLIELSCGGCSLTSLPPLPPGLRLLNAILNQLDSLPILPASLETLEVSYNQLTFLGSLPANLEVLECDDNFLTSLPALPAGLMELRCADNQLTTLPAFPNSLHQINLNNNLITVLPTLPDSVYFLYLNNNPITCLPRINKLVILHWNFTNIECLPNYFTVSYADPPLTIPLCDPFGACPFFWNISGKAFYDADSSCIQDSGEVSLKGIQVTLDSGSVQLQQMYTDDYGRFSFQTGYGTYEIHIDTLDAPYHVVCPASFTAVSILNSVDSMDSDIDFGLVCNPGFDLIASSISPNLIFRPGFETTLMVNAGDAMAFGGTSCANSINGSVQLILGNFLSYVSPAIGALTPTAVNGDTVTWTIADFGTVDPANDFNVKVLTSTLATINDSTCVSLSIFPSADNNSSNNSISECFPIRGSFDPNEKYMYPSGLVDTSTYWFNFTVYFQNTGTAPAINIYILDTLDENLDPSTFDFLSSSHDVVIQILPGNIIRFNYPHIFLPDSNFDEPGSHGFVKYKVKRKSNLPINTVILNTAYIYFDFNPAIVTNTVFARLSVHTGAFVSDQNAPIEVYPNPVQNQLTVDSRQYSISSIEIRNLVGELVFSENNQVNSKIILDIRSLHPGLYFLKVESEKGPVVKRFIKL